MTFRTDNTDGFLAWELTALNAALAVVTARTGMNEKSATDAINNAYGVSYPAMGDFGRPSPATDLENAAPLMDDEIREALHDKLTDCEPHVFGLAYAVSHAVIRNEIFEW